MYKITKYILISHYENVGQNNNIKVGKSLENMAELKTQTDLQTGLW
jgi:hypothetical protein